MVMMIGLFALGYFIGLVVASLAEYWVHVLMHRGIFLSRTHFNHHREPEDESWFKQFGYFMLGGAVPWLLVCVVSWLLGVLVVGLAFMAGCVSWAAWVAYAHTLQHLRPEQCFWMSMPVHHVHHAHEMSQHNFGLSIDWWDRVFGTYVRVPYERPKDTRISLWALLTIRWF